MDRLKSDLQRAICSYCEREGKKNYPDSIGCAFRCIDNTFCDSVDIMTSIFSYLIYERIKENGSI